MGNVRPSHGQRHVVRCVGDPEWPSHKEIGDLLNIVKTFEASPMVVWMWGMPLVNKPEIPEGLVVLDGYDLEVWFSPVVFAKPLDTCTILPAKRIWADLLIPLRSELRLFTSELMLRKTKAFYRYASGYRSLRRGARILFYVGEEGIRGEARVERLDIDSPEALYARYGPRGVYSRREIEDHSNHSGNSLAYLFSWYREWPYSLNLNKIKKQYLNSIQLRPTTSQTFKRMS